MMGIPLAAVMFTDNDRFDLGEQLLTTSILLLGITLVLMLWATRIPRRIGNSGASMLAGIEACFSLR